MNILKKNKNNFAKKQILKWSHFNNKFDKRNIWSILWNRKTQYSQVWERMKSGLYVRFVCQVCMSGLYVRFVCQVCMSVCMSGLYVRFVCLFINRFVCHVNKLFCMYVCVFVNKKVCLLMQKFVCQVCMSLYKQGCMYVYK